MPLSGVASSACQDTGNQSQQYCLHIPRNPTVTNSTDRLISSQCLRLVVWPHDGVAIAATYGERNGRIKNQKRFDRHSALVSSTVGPMSSSLSACTRSRMRARSYARVMQDARQSAAVTLNQMVFWVVVQGRSSLRYLPGRRVVSPSVIRVRVPVSRIKFDALRMEVVLSLIHI